MEGDVRSDSSGGRDAGAHLGLAPVSWIRFLGPFPGGESLVFSSARESLGSPCSQCCEDQHSDMV